MILQPNTIYDILKPVLYITKIFGLTPFSLRGNYYQTSPSCTAWSLLVLIFLCSYSVYAFIHLIHSKSEGLITELTQRLQEYCSLFSMFSGILFSCIYQKKILFVIQQLHQIDCNFHKLEEPIPIRKSYSKAMWRVLTVTFFLIIYVVANVVFDAMAFLNEVTLSTVGNIVAFVMPTVVAVLVTIQFCTIVLFVRRRFKVLNKRLEEGCGNPFVGNKSGLQMLNKRFTREFRDNKDCKYNENNKKGKNKGKKDVGKKEEEMCEDSIFDKGIYFIPPNASRQLTPM